MGVRRGKLPDRAPVKQIRGGAVHVHVVAIALQRVGVNAFHPKGQTVLRRRRETVTTTAKPVIISAQVEGSGTADGVKLRMRLV
jgi:hypothetical protein